MMLPMSVCSGAWCIIFPPGSDKLVVLAVELPLATGKMRCEMIKEGLRFVR